MKTHRPADRLAAALSTLLLLAHPATGIAQIVADPTAGSYKPTVGAAANGLPVVQITAPSAAGVSRNQYQQFDIGSQGAILNNSATVVQTQQAGWIAGNPNLSGGSARIILNEVTSTLPSTLAGSLEIAGSSADLVVANPNGITCNGCGFINANRSVLTTGTPVFGGDGSLAAFRVVGGAIAIEGAGLNAANVDRLDLIARSVAVNAELWAKNLNVVAGANQVNYADLGVTTIAGAGGVPTVAIDVAALGGMYADKIRLVGTEAGVGVVNAGRLAAQAGDLAIDAAGHVTLSGATSARDNLVVTAGEDIVQSGALYAQGNATLTAGGALANTGTLAAAGHTTLRAASLANTGTLGAGIHTDGSLGNAGNLSVTTTGGIASAGQTLAGGHLALTGTRLTLAGNTTRANLGATLTATAGAIDHSGGDLRTGGLLSLAAAGTVTNDNGLMAGDQVSLVAAGLANRNGNLQALDSLMLQVAGTVNNASGILYSATDLGLTAGNYTGDGTLLAERDLSLTLSGDYTQTAGNTLQANRNLSLTLGGTLTNEGTLSAVNQLDIHAAQIDNRSAGLLEAADATLAAAGAFTNAGGIVADTLAVSADSIANTGSVFGQDIAINARSLTNSGAGAIAAGNSLGLYVTDELDNLDGGLIYSAGTLAIAGSDHRGADGWLDTPLAHLLNRSADIEAGGDLEVTATTVDNKRTSYSTATRTVSTSTQLFQQIDDAWSVPDGRTVANHYTVTRIQTECTGIGGTCVDVTYYDTYPYGSAFWGPAPAPESIPTFALYHLPGAVAYERRRVVISDQKEDYVVSATAEARMMVGGDLYLRAGTVNNNASRIEAAGTLAADVGSLNNTGVTLYDRTRTTTWHGACWDIQGDSAGRLGNCNSGWIWTADIADSVTGTGASLDAAFSGAASLSLSAVTIANSTVGVGGLPAGGVNLTVGSTTLADSAFTFTAPDGGLYHQTTAPGATYLVETDPRFTRFASFISSDYMLARLDLDPAAITKRLGDGFYEQQLVRDQIIQQRGSNTLGASYASLDAEYQALLDAGIAYAQAFAIRPGISLSAEQIAGLSQNMVWLEERVVDGQKVLVPVVYLLPTDALRPTGGILAGNTVTLAATDIRNSGTIAAAGTLVATASHDLANDSGQIEGDTVALAAGHDLRLGVDTAAIELHPGQTFTQQGLAGTVSGNTVTLAAGNDLTLAGGALGGGSATLTAGHDLTVGTKTLATEQHILSGGSQFDRSATAEQGSVVALTGNLTLAAGHDLTVSGSAAVVGGSLTGVAGNDLSVREAKGRETIAAHIDDGFLTGSLHADNETVSGSLLQAGGNVVLQSGRDLSLAAADVTSTDGGVTLAATRDLTVGAASERRQTQGQVHTEERGFLSGSSVDDALSSDTTTAYGSSVSGNTVSAVSGRNLAVTGSQVVGTGDVTLAAQGNLVVDTAENRSAVNRVHAESQTGLFSSGGASITLGTRSRKLTDDNAQVWNTGSTVGSVSGNVTLAAGEAYRQTGSAVLAPAGDIDITAATVDIDAAYDTYQDRQTFEAKQAGLTLAVSSPVIAAVQTVQQMRQAADQTSSSRMKALAAANAALAAKTAFDAVKAGQGTTIDEKDNQIVTGKDADGKLTSRDASAAEQAGGINVSISLGASRSASQSDTRTRTAVASTVAAGQDVRITATGQDANLTVQGSDIVAGGNATLAAEGAVRLLAAQNTVEQHSSNHSSSGSVGISFGTGGFGISASASQGRGHADGSDVAWRNTHVTAGQTLTLASGGDTTLKGAVASGNQVVADVGGNLLVESLQDTSRYDSEQASMAGSVTFGAGVSGSFSASQSQAKSDYASVIEQSGIQAGDGGFQVHAAGDTTLTGGVIASSQKAVDDGLNTFSTGGTLTLSDIQNHADYQASSAAVSVGAAPSLDGTLKPAGTSAGFGSDAASADSVTAAGISGIAGNTAARTGDSATALANTFDATRVQGEIDAQALITQTFGREASKAIGDYADKKLKEATALQTEAEQIRETNPDQAKALDAQAQALEDQWGNQGSMRLLAHTVVGGLTGGASGAAGAAASTLAAPEIAQALNNAGVDPDLAKAITGVATTTLGAAVGGSAGAGAALNEVANNYLYHAEAAKLQAAEKRLRECTDDACRQSAQKEIDDYNKRSALRDDALRTACAENPAGANCQVQIGLAKEALATYDGKSVQRYSTVGEQRAHAANMVDTAHYQPDGMRLLAARIGMPVAIVGGVAATVTAGEIASFCLFNPATCSAVGIEVGNLAAGDALPTGVNAGAIEKTAARMAEEAAEAARAVTSEGKANAATVQKLADSLASNMSKPVVADTKLGQLMDDLYREGAKVGSGSTADAVRYEIATGNSVGGVYHTQKAEDYSVALERWLASNPNASFSDRSAAQNVLRDLQNALKGN